MNTNLIKIIIVDDANVIRSVLRSILVNEGYEISAMLSSGRGLMGSIRKHKPQIVCLDYNLPDCSGLELLTDIHEQYPTIAVVMITGDESDALKVAATESGASGFIHKPFTQELIKKEMQQIAAAQRLLETAKTSVTKNTTRNAMATAIIADDSKAMRMLLAAILEKANVEILGMANDGQQAVDLAIEKKPDIIFLDIEMPVLNGIDALNKIKNDYSDAKVLIISSSSEKGHVKQAIEMGAKGYIVKPYQPVQVIKAIKGLLKKAS